MRVAPDRRWRRRRPRSHVTGENMCFICFPPSPQCQPRSRLLPCVRVRVFCFYLSRFTTRRVVKSKRNRFYYIKSKRQKTIIVDSQIVRSSFRTSSTRPQRYAIRLGGMDCIIFLKRPANIQTYYCTYNN